MRWKLAGEAFGARHITDCFRAIVASSVGVSNAAAWMPHVEVEGEEYGQIHRSRRYYEDVFAGSPFNNYPFKSGFPYIDWEGVRGIVQSKAIVNVNLLAEEFDKFGLDVPLDQSTNATKMVFIGTKLRFGLPWGITLEKVLTEEFSDQRDLIKEVRDHSIIPLISGMRFPRVFDGVFVDPTGIPTAFEYAESLGVRRPRVLALSNFPMKESDNPDLYIVAPDKSHSMSPIEKNPSVVEAFGWRGVRTGFEMFGVTKELSDALLDAMSRKAE